MTNNNNDQWPDDSTDLPTGSTDAGDAARPAGDDLRDTIDGIGQDTDEILDILRDGRSTPTPRPTPTGQPRPRRSRNAVIDELVDDITSQVTRDLADAMPPPEAPTDEAPDRQMPLRQRDARGRWTPNQPPIPATDTPTTDPAGEPDPDSSDTATADDPQRQTRRRDSRGRWVRDDRPTTDISSRNQDGSSSSDTEQLGRDGESPAYWDRLAGAVGQGMQNASQGVDPTIEALREAGVFKAVSWVFGSKKDKVPKEQGKHNRVVERLLKRLVGQSDDSSRSGGLGMMLLRLAPFLVAAVLAGLGAMAPAIAVAIAAAVANSIGGLISGLLPKTEAGQKALDTIGELTARAASALGNDDARAVVDANDATDDAQRYASRERNGNWGSTDRIYEFARSFGLGGLFKSGNAQVVSAGNVTSKNTPLAEKLPKNANKYDQVMIEEYARQGFSLEEMAILKGQVHAESGFNPLAKSPANAQGLSQFIPSTARQYKVQYGDSPQATRSQLAGQAKYMRYLLNRYNGDWDKARAGYNAGEGNVDQAIARAAKSGRTWKDHLPKPQETLPYLERINQFSKMYRFESVTQSATVPPVTLSPKPTQQAPVTLPISPKALAEHAEQQPIPTPAPTVNLGSRSTTKLISPSMPYLPIRTAAIKLPAQPSVAQRLNTSPPPAPTSSSDDSMTQNVSDRQLAHLITGGLGMGGQVV